MVSPGPPVRQTALAVELCMCRILLNIGRQGFALPMPKGAQVRHTLERRESVAYASGKTAREHLGVGQSHFMHVQHITVKDEQVNLLIRWRVSQSLFRDKWLGRS
ncbi:hypothetical protein EMIT0P253_10240 [Pseudomonas sp. IT-P253]